MKKTILILAVFVGMVSTSFALTIPTNSSVEAKLELYDANTGGPVTENTREVTVFAKVKADTPVGAQTAVSLVASISQLNITDFDGNTIVDSQIPITNVPFSVFQGYSGLQGNGETSVRLGNIKFINANGKYIHPKKGLVVNAYFELDQIVETVTYAYVRASEIISFN